MISKSQCAFYLIRHGETEWNRKGLIQGHTNNPLNKTGEEQAKKLAKKLKKINFVSIYSSDLLRAKKTAEIIAQSIKLPIIINPFLRERDFGPFEGKSESLLDIWRKKLTHNMAKLTIQEKELIKKIKNKIESDKKMMKRFIPYLKKLAQKHQGKNVLIITHGGILRVFLITIGFFKNEQESFTYKIKNTAYVKVIFENSKFTVKETFNIKKDEKDKN